VVRVDTAAAPAEAYGAFRDFLAWIREAHAMTLVLDRD
jgi:hypothetical protein